MSQITHPPPPRTAHKRQLTENQVKEMTKLFNEFFIERESFMFRWHLLLTDIMYIKTMVGIDAMVITQEEALLSSVFEITSLLKILQEYEK